MKYYLIEVTTYTDSDKEDKGMYSYESYNDALASFYTKIGGLMKKDNTASELVVIIDTNGNVLRSDKYEKPIIVDGETVSKEV